MKKLAKFLTIRWSIALIFLNATIPMLYPKANHYCLAVLFTVWIISVHREKLINETSKD